MFAAVPRPFHLVFSFLRLAAWLVLACCLCMPAAVAAIADPLPDARTPFLATIRRFEPRYWIINPCRESAGALVTRGADSLHADLLFRRTGNNIGVSWQSNDRYDHRDLRYPTRQDYRGLVWRFRWHGEHLAPLNQFDAPLLTIRGRDENGHAREWQVRLGQAKYAKGGYTDCEITLNFNDLYAGWSPQDHWEKVYTGDIDELSFSLAPYAPVNIAGVSLQRDPDLLTVTTAEPHHFHAGQRVALWGLHLPRTYVDNTYTITQVLGDTGFTVAPPQRPEAHETGSQGVAYLVGQPGANAPPFAQEINASLDLTTLGLTLLPGSDNELQLHLPGVEQPAHDLRLCTSYGDQYHLTPARIVENAWALGFREWVDHYVGISGWPNTSWSEKDRRFIIDPAKPPLSSPARAWHTDYYRRLAARGYKVISSISFELEDSLCPAEWAQCDADGKPGQTDYTPPSYLISPCHAGARAYVAGAGAAFGAIAAGAGMTPYVQIGEPWWWAGCVSRQVPAALRKMCPCFYDAATRAAYQQTFGTEMPAWRDTRASTTGHEATLTWLRDRLGAALLDMRDTVKARCHGAQLTVLPYVPGVTGADIGMMSVVNWPEACYKAPQWDFFMIEDYEYQASGDLTKVEQTLKLPESLGYAPDKIHYLLGSPQHLAITGVKWDDHTVTVQSPSALVDELAMRAGDTVHLTHTDFPDLDGEYPVATVAADGLSFTITHPQSRHAAGAGGYFSAQSWDNSWHTLDLARRHHLGAIYLWAYPQVNWGDITIPRK